MNQNKTELNISKYFYPILLLSFFLVTAIYVFFPSLFSGKSNTKFDENGQEIAQVHEENIQNIEKLQNAENLEDNPGAKIYVYWNVYEQKTLSLETKDITNYKTITHLASPISNIIFEYNTWYSYWKPSFKILSWWNYINSWNKIIFPFSPLSLKFKKHAYIWWKFFASWDILEIENISLLPRFYAIDYKFQKNNQKIFYSNTIFNYNQQYKSDSLESLINNDNMTFHDENGVFTFSYKIKLWTEGNFTFKSFDRKSSVDDFKLVWYTNKENLDFNNNYKGFEQLNLPNQDEKLVYFDFSDYLTINNNGNLTINYKDLPKNTWFLLSFNEKEKEILKKTYKVEFETIDDFKVISVKDLFKTKQKINNYHICVNQPLNEDQTKKSIEKSFGDNKVSVSFSAFDDYRKDIWYGNLCVFFYYYTNPEKEQDFNLQLFSLYGWNLKENVHIWKYEIPAKSKSKDIVWENINILPLKGEFADKIQLTSNNHKNIEFYTRNCKIDTQNIAKTLQNQKEKVKKYDPINALFGVLNCEKYAKQSYKIENFEYWKWHLSNFSLENIKSNIFETSIGTWFSNPKIFFKTNLWILAKKADNNLFVWVNSLSDAQALKNVDIDFYWMKNNDNQIYKISWKTDENWFLKLKIPEDTQIWFLKAAEKTDENIIFLNLNYSFQLNGNYINFTNTQDIQKYQVWLYDYWWEEKNSIKAYIYSDRLLYKPWDDIFVSWWLRQIWWNSVTWDVDVILTNNDGFSQKIENVNLDEFGAFTWTFKLPKTVQLWNYELQVEKAQDGKNYGFYTSYINVQEYKKNTFFLNDKNVESWDWKWYLRIQPEYYFWWNLPEYDAQVWLSFKADQYGYYDRFWCNESKSSKSYCNEPIYYNLNQSEQNFDKKFTIKNYKNPYIDIPSNIENKTFWHLTYDLTVIDLSSKEVLDRRISKNLAPKYAIWFFGRSYDYFYDKNFDLKIKWKLLKETKTEEFDEKINEMKFNKLSNEKIQIKIYQKDFKTAMEKWPDNERYYANWADYKLIKEDETLSSNWEFSYDFKPERWWSYFIRAIYKWFETQKTVYVYADNDYSYGFYGNMKNNLKLDLKIKDQEYLPWDEIEINIDPYIKDARAIITVEQWNKIKEIKTTKLDWNVLKLVVQKDRYPNVFVSMALIVGEKQNSQISQKRSEPRFLLWYAPVKLNKSMVQLKYDLQILDAEGKEKEYFQPNEKVVLKIRTYDSDWNAQESRISVWVIDKALLDIYDEMRKPIEYFYNMFGNFVSVFANYKNLYKSLKVFTADGTKWWWGQWDSWLIVNLRKNFLDTAYWNPAVYTDPDWNATIEFQTPDNLTTWTIDMIAISKTDKMWIFRKDFKVNKDVILQANLPNFLTLGDKIDIPYKILINNNDIKKENLKLKSFVEISGKKYDLKLENSVFKLDLSKVENADLMKQETISINFQVTQNDKILDAIVKHIPLRTEWFVLSQFLFENTNKIKKTFDFKQNADFINVNINISKAPISAFEKAFSYLLHYPYGCAEQVISGLYPIIIAQNLSKAHLISEHIIKDWKVSIRNKRYDISEIVETSLFEVYKHQKSDWWMWYWLDKYEQSDKFLSVYVYWVAKQIQKNWYEVSEKFLNKLEQFIVKQKDKNLILYYYLQKVLSWEKIDSKFVLENANNDYISNVLAYFILKMENPEFDDYELKENIKKIFTDKNLKFDNLKNSWDTVFFSKNILKSYFVRALNANEAAYYVQEILNSRNANAIRWYSTQENVQMIVALGDYIQKIKNDKDIDYKLKIQDKYFEWKSWKNEQSKTFNLNLTWLSKLEIELTSSEKLLNDIKIDYIPSDLSKIESFDENVSIFNFSAQLSWENKSWTLTEVLSNAEIWDKIDLIGEYKVDKNAEKVAIVYYIPANLNLINPNLSKQNYRYYEDSLINFQHINSQGQSNKYWYDCVPDHFEVRFDRLFMYYSKINKDLTCKVKLKWIKTHDWKLNIMPSKLFEMYNTQVRANKIAR